MNKAVKGFGRIIYTGFALFLALVALGMSYVSDGTVPLYVHILVPLLVILIFFSPVLIWRRMNAGSVPSPLPIKIRKYQDKFIVIFLILWVAGAIIGYFAARSN